MIEKKHSDGSSLCRVCGFCCDGTLFYYTPTGKTGGEGCATCGKPEEASRIPQPCPHHGSESGCGIYDCRPDVCRDFQCELLSDLLDGKINLSDALGVIGNLKTLKEKIKKVILAKSDHLDPLPFHIQFERLHHVIKHSQGESLKAHGEFYLDYLAFIHLVRKYLLSEFMADEKEGEARDLPKE